MIHPSAGLLEGFPDACTILHEYADHLSTSRSAGLLPGWMEGFSDLHPTADILYAIHAVFVRHFARVAGGGSNDCFFGFEVM